MVFDLDLIKKTYSGMPAKVEAAKKALGRPLTLAEKILFAHLWDGVSPRDFQITDKPQSLYFQYCIHI